MYRSLKELRYMRNKYRIRYFSGGAAKPGWHVDKLQRFGPEIPDKQYFWDHPNYTGFVLWLRGVRPYAEKIIGDSWITLVQLYERFLSPVQNFIVNHNPEFRLKIIAFLSFYFTAQTINMAFNRNYQKIMDLKHMEALEAAKQMEDDQFWLSESEDLDNRTQIYSNNHHRLNEMWEKALTEATQVPSAHEGFAELCKYLDSEKNEASSTDVLLPPITCKLTADAKSVKGRFNMIPYGDEDASTIPVPEHEQPKRAFALNFTYNNLAYDWGDYINRKDNKNSLMRPSRIMFTDVLIPPTK